MQAFDPHDDPLSLPLPVSLQLWVLLPITATTILISLLRRNLLSIIIVTPPPTLSKITQANSLARSATLRRNASYLPPSQFDSRRLHLIRNGGSLDKSHTQLTLMTTFMNPHLLANHAVAIAISVFPQMFIGQWASSCFAGLVVCRLPFTLSPRFRSMLQAGIESAGRTLDVSYVSSFSWYILSLFGNSGLLSLISFSNPQQPLPIPNLSAGLAPAINPNKAFFMERDALVSAHHKCTLAHQYKQFLNTDVSQFALR